MLCDSSVDPTRSTNSDVTVFRLSSGARLSSLVPQFEQNLASEATGSWQLGHWPTESV